MPKSKIPASLATSPEAEDSSRSGVSRTGTATTASTGKVDEKTLPIFVRHKAYGWLLILTSVVAFNSAFMLVLDKMELLRNKDAKLLCDVNSILSCGSVMGQWQADLFGFPNPLIGVVGFGVTFTLGFTILSGAKLARWYWLLIQLGMTLAMIWVVWFWTQALFAIGILCPNCMVVWAMVIPMFIWTTARNLAHGVIPAPARLRMFLANWGWPIIVILYLAVFASIFFRFIGLFISTNA